MNQKTTWEVVLGHEGDVRTVLVEAEHLGGAEREALALFPGWSFIMAQSVFSL